MCLKTELVFRDSASTLLIELANTMNRLGDRLSSKVLREVFQTLEGVFQCVEGVGLLLRVVSSDSGSGPTTAAGEHVVEVQLTDRCRELIATLQALDRDLELVCKRHGFLSGESSPISACLHSGEEGQAGV
jgi:hypothetical protein